MTNKEFDRSLSDLKKQKGTKSDNDSQKKINSNSIKITRKKENEKKSRNYILKQKHIDFVDRVARRTQRDKSEIVQIALEYLEENIELD